MQKFTEDESDIFDFLEKQSSEGKKPDGLWSDLYDRLTAYEANALDKVMEKASFLPGQVIFRQGAVSSNLYFFETGSAKHIFTHHGRETFIKKIQAGNIAGEDNFFHVGICTTTLIAIDRARVLFLSLDRLKEETDVYDSLIEQLRIFCAREEKIRDLLHRNAQDRRHHQRVSLQGSTLIKPADNSSPSIEKSLRGEIRDISSGGMAVVVKLDAIENAQALLGNKFKVRFSLPPNMNIIERVGQVLGFSCQDGGVPLTECQKSYSLNIKFTELVEAESIREYANYLKRTTDVS